MLTAILERNAPWVYALGMPLVYLYHLLLSNVFLNTAAEDAKGLERLGNEVLAPFHYFFEGKKGTVSFDAVGNRVYTIERRFDYQDRFFIKTAAAFTLLPYSLAFGSTLKGISYLSGETRERACSLHQSLKSTKVTSLVPYYRSIGMEINDYRQAEWLDPPRFKRHPSGSSQVNGDLEALQAISDLLSSHGIPFWIDCGSCLGAYQYGGAIPNDWDIDIAVLLPDFENVRNVLKKLDPEKFMIQDWSGRARPKSLMKLLVRQTGGMIDLYHFAIDPVKKEVSTLFSNEDNIFTPPSWKIRERRYTTPIPFAHIFPLKKALFEGIEVPVPGNTIPYLQTFYGENLAPARIYNELTGSYEKDLSHPYWQLPAAH